MTLPNIFTRLHNLYSPPETLSQKDQTCIDVGVLGTSKRSLRSVIIPSLSMSTLRIAAVAARDKQRATHYATTYSIPRTHPSYDSLINDPDLQVIYNPLPKTMHLDWTLRALQRGKCVILDRPISSNHEQTQLLYSAASTPQQILVGFHFLYHPAVTKLLEMASSGRIGMITDIQIHYQLPKWFLRHNELRFNALLGGGACLYLGSCCIALIQALLKKEANAVTAANAQMFRPEIDQCMRATIEFSDVSSASFDCGYGANLLKFPKIMIKGTRGILKMKGWALPSIWHRIKCTDLASGQTEIIQEYGDGSSSYVYMLEAFVSSLKSKEQNAYCTREFLEQNIRLIDQIYTKANLRPRGSSE